MNTKHEIVQLEDGNGQTFHAIQMGNKKFYEEHTTYGLRTTESIFDARLFLNEKAASDHIRMLTKSFDEFGNSR